MSFKTDIKKQLADITAKLSNAENQQSVAWQEAYDLALKAQIQADRVVASYGADSCSINKVEIKLKQLWNYKLPSDIAKAYWWDANNFADWMIEYLPFNAVNDDDIEQVELFKRYAFLWGSAVWVKETKMAGYFGGWSLDGKKVRVSFTSINQDNIAKLEKTLDYQELDKEAVVVLTLWWDRVGFWVKAIPYLGTYIYYKRNWQKTMSFAQIIPVLGVSNDYQKNQIAQFLSDCDNFEWNPPKDPTNKLAQGDFIGEKMKWLVPEGIKEMFDAQTLTVDKHWELLCNYFGRVVENASGEQRLSADANTFSSNSEYIMKGFVTRIKMIEKQMEGVASLEEEKMEEQLDETKGESDNNDNAEKDSGSESEKGERKEGVEV